ncbi:MAG: DUF3109 family protein [Cytophagales bacterium]|nr:DUF3109 family protein [Cytophagales bacterium]
MLAIHDTLIADDIIQSYFVCDLLQCKGACCEAGDAGAPLQIHELPILEQIYDEVKSYLPQDSIAAIEQNGLYDTDSEGEFCTTTVDSKQCVFASKNNNIWQCSIEKAYQEGKISFQKPASCHLYPIRVAKTPYGHLLNYHQWHICAPACNHGAKLKIPLYVFLKQPLIQKFGEEWYNILCQYAENK